MIEASLPVALLILSMPRHVTARSMALRSVWREFGAGAA